ncbi:cationic amino acid transporter 4-like [Lineus longissimus]|uniref:cationic amino acid transporter 4-like n=1 Tax=Lineus longissimus TaxID=88925 RepID=UPI002B4FA561
MSKCGELTTGFLRKLGRKKAIPKDVMETPLKRCLTTSHLVFLGIGQMAGAGMYIMTGVVAKQHAGPATFLSYIIAGFVSFLSAMCYAEFAARVPRAGSSYSYAYVTVGEFIAFVIGWNILLEHCIGGASTARAWSGSFDTLFGNVIRNWTLEHASFQGQPSWLAQYPDFIAPLFLIILCIAVAFGAKTSVNINMVVAVTNIIFTILISVLGYYYAKPENWTSVPFAPNGVGGVVVGASMCVYAYIGIDGISVAGEEAKSPTKSIPRANTIALIVVTVMYVAMSLALVLVVPYTSLSMSAPFAEAFDSLGHRWIKTIVIVGTLIAITCTTLGHTFSAPRTMYAMAGDGVIFRFISYVNPRTQTPLVAVLIFLIIAAVLTVLFNLEQLANMSSIGTILTFFGVSACVIVLRYQPRQGECTDETQLVDNATDNDQKSDPDTYEIWNNSGRLKPKFKDFPILKNMAPGSAVVMATGSMSVAMLVLCCVAILGMKHLASGTAWAVLVTIFSVLWLVASFTVLLLHEQDSQITTYKVPFVPLLPSISMLLNMALLLNLEVAVWIRLGVWMTAGFLIYFAYGIHHTFESTNTLTVAQPKNYASMDDSCQNEDRPRSEKGKES